VSLIDNRNQYVVAEVSKSVSLYKGDHHPDDEGLCMGVKVLDLLSGICAGTMPCFINSDGRHDISTSNIVANSQGFVINDFTLEPHFAEKPYVVAFPFMRFYAGVPIRSSSGHVIGAYAVIDNQPRKGGLDDQGLLLLNEIATSIMRHLELLKVQTSHDSALSLLGSLKSFVQGSNISADTPAAKPGVEKVSSPVETECPDGSESGDPNSEHHIAAGHESSPASHDNTESRRRHFKLESTPQRSKAHRTPNGVKTSSKKVVNGTPPSSDRQHNSPRGSTPATASGQYGSLLGRAADSILAAMRMDEVFFIDAPSPTAQNTEGSINAKAGASVTGKTLRSSSTGQVEATGPHATGRDHILRPPPSNSSPHSTTFKPIHTRANDEYCISQALHTELLSQYPRGSFFNFMTKWAEEVSAFDSNGDYNEANGMTLERGKLVHGENSRNHGTSLNDALQSAFPSAQSMMFLPLFSAENGDCPFSIVAWSSEDRRILQQEDFAYLGLFGVAIQAEFARIISAIQNRAKSDFISSISHEVRSPLHGILGNAELLLDSEIEQEQRQMAEMIEKCGRSLLSTMEHM